VRRALLGLGSACLALGLAGCEPSCRSTCRSVLKCELGVTPIALEECEASCVFQERLYDEAEDERRRDALTRHKRCLNRSRCAEIEAGACYDEDVFIF